MEHPNETGLTAFARWLELRMATVQPGLHRLLVDLERVPSDAPLAPLVSEAWRRWHGSPLAARLDGVAERLGLDALDLAVVMALHVLGVDLQLDALRRQGFNDDAFFEAGLIARLLPAPPEVMARLAPEAPLVSLGLVHLNVPAARPHAARRHHFVELDEAAVALVEGRAWLPPELARCIECLEPATDGAAFFVEQVERLDRAAQTQRDTAPFVALCSPSTATSRLLASTWSERTGRPVLVADFAAARRGETPLDDVAGALVREARLRDAVVLVEIARSWDALDEIGAASVLSALNRIAAHLKTPLLLDAPLKGEEALRATLSPLYEVRTLPPTLSEQVAIWRRALEAVGLAPLSEGELREEVCDLAVEIGDIRRAAELAAHNARLLVDNSADTPLEVTAETLRGLAASKLNQGMLGVAERIPTTLTWRDFIAPDAVLEGLMDVITYARYQRQVFEDWGFASKMPYGRSNSCLFSGPPGTGKTMAAGVVARELGMDLYRVDLSQIVSKWVGETEKNLARVFDEASRGHAVLLFDEADSLFGKRTEVKSSNDRYNNLQVNYLLQRIESFDGIAILTTNLADAIDEAFARRVKFKVAFPVPDAEHRARLWQVMLPSDAERAPEIDFDHLGEAFEMAGAHIKNTVLRAAFRAAESGLPISTELLEESGIAELREMGKLVRVDPAGRLVVPDPERQAMPTYPPTTH